VPAQVRLAAGEVFELELALGEGPYRLRGPQLPWSVDFHVVKGAAARRWDIDLARGPERGMPLELAPGAQDFLLRNDSTQELVVRVERAIPRTHVLSAAKASTLALFRELFPSERLAPGQLVSIATLTFLATDLDLPMSLYESLGDARAFALIHEHFQILGDAVREGRGAIVKTIGEGVLAAFSEPVGAVRVGLELQDRLRGGKNTRDLRVRVGLHHGPAMATTLDDRLDYFGATVDQTLRLAHAARGGDVVISRSLAGNVSVAEVLRSCHGSNEVIEIGVAGQPVAVRVSRVS
jgi:class 3 adenylate cyclase